MKFKQICQCYNKLEKTTKKLEMVDILSQTLKDASPTEIGKISLFTIGKLYPEYVGIELMLAEKMAIKALSRASGKSEKQIEKMMANIGDIGKITYIVLSKKTQTSLLDFTGAKQTYLPEFLEIWQLLNEIAHLSGEGSNEKKINKLSGILSKISPLEAKYLVRMVVGKLRLGVAIQLLLEALALAKTGDRENKSILERAYNRTSNISLVAEKLFSEGLDGVKKIDVQMGIPIKVMLAQRVSSAEELLERFKGKVALEYKYDGLRAQIHFDNGKIKLFSRRPEDITDQFPDLQDYMREAANTSKFIIEGEVVAFDYVNEKILPFQTLTQRKRKYLIEEKKEEIPVRVFLFDALYVDGKVLLDEPLLTRRKYLTEIIKETEHVKFSHMLIADNADTIEHFFMQAINDGCEGIMGKSIAEDSVYQAGARGWNWVKYKADYVDKLSDSFDLVIVGADYGKGKRAGKYGSFLLCAYNVDEGRFETFTRVATGFSDEDLDRFYNLLKPLECSKPKNVYSNIDSQVWFEPKIIIEVSGAEITRSQLHTCASNKTENNEGLALRFPRFTGRIVEDRLPEEATSTDEILTIYLNKKKEKGT